MKKTLLNPLHIPLCGIAALAATGNCVANEPVKPNVVFILADDIGYGDFSTYGASKVKTSNVDFLAENGVKFTNAHAVAATSTPSRYSLLTGEYAFRRNDTGVAAGNAASIIKSNQGTVAKVFKEAGYTTGAVGKWHLGLGETTGQQDWNTRIPTGPYELGFDYSFIMAATADRVPCVFMENQEIVNADPTAPVYVSYSTAFEGEPLGSTHPELLSMKSSHGHNQAIVNGIGRIGYMKGGGTALWKDEHIADNIAEKAVEFINENKDNPFFLYLGTNDIHVPRVPHERFEGKSGMGPRGDAILSFDWTVGEVLNALEANNLLENTLIILTSDNGPVVDDGYQDQAVQLLGDHKPWGPFHEKGGKYSAYEAGTCVPFIVHWPAEIQTPRESPALVSHIDFYATMANLLGVELPETGTSDSQVQLDTWLGKDLDGREFAVTQSGTLGIIRDNWKYITPNSGAAYQSNTDVYTGYSLEDQLYDIEKDYQELNNVAGENPQIVEELKALLEKVKWNTDVEFDDFKLEIASGVALGSDGLTAEQSDIYSIEKAIDGDLDNEYSSQWGGRTQMPVTIDLTLKETDRVDYIVFYPKGPVTSNLNGYWNEFEVHTSTDGTNFTKSKDYQFIITEEDKTSTYTIKAPRKIELPEPVKDVQTVRIIVKSSYHSNATDLPQLVSCAEIEIYKKDLTSIEIPNQKDTFQVATRNGYIYVTGNESQANVFATDGRKVNIKEKQIPGIYIVTADGNSKKVRVE